jgi:3-isopropylmalate dehydrogenase
MKRIRVALVEGDGAAPEMMAVACAVAQKAAEQDGVYFDFEKTPMGWDALGKFGDTLPAESLAKATDIGLLFFGGVGEKALDKTLGVQFPKMRPEGRCLLTIRDKWGLLINERPAIFHPELRGLAKVRENEIPASGIRQFWLRYLLEGEYFGNREFIGNIGHEAEKLMGLKLKDDVTGDEPVISNIEFLTQANVVRYFRYAFGRARELKMPLICVAKANVLPTHLYFWLNAKRIQREEFPDVDLREVVYSDDGTQLLFEPSKLEGVIACTNKDGDMLSDGALKAVGSMGLMCSSAINPVTGAAMFESGAGTYPEAKGKDIANPIGRILTGAMLNRYVGNLSAAQRTEASVRKTLLAGYRTPDLFKDGVDDSSKLVGTTEIGRLVISNL